MAWFGDSIGNIKNQISSFTREVLNETQEENKGSSDDKELEVSRDLIADLEKLCLEQKDEIDRLKLEIRQSHEKPEDINLQDQEPKDKSEDFQKIIANKEEEILRLKDLIAASKESKQLLEHEVTIEDNKLAAIVSEENQVPITKNVSTEATVLTFNAQTATDDSDIELQESYSKELEERCNSYQNDLYVLRGELMALQSEYDHHIESTEKLNEEILDRMHSDFIIDGQPSLRFHKKQSDESGKLLFSVIGQLSTLWRDLVEKKGTLERTVAKLSAGNRQEFDNDVELSPESTPIKAIQQQQQQQQQMTDFLPPKIDSFGLETILEEERGEEESFTESFQHDEQAASISIHKSTVETLPPINSSVTSWTQTNEDKNEDEEQKLPCNYLGNLLEQEKEWMAKVSERDEKIRKLESDLDRLKSHLVELEEQYTSEAVVSEEKEKGLKFQMAELQKEIVQTIQQNERNGSIREEVVRLNAEKELLKSENVSLEDQIAKMNTQLQNLHFVLEQFQKEKASEIKGLEKSFRAEKAELEAEKDRIEKDLLLESSLLAKARAGLDAAQELSTQIEEKSRIIGDLKVQVAEREAEVGKFKSQMDEVSKNLDGKIDRYLIKNLIVGYFSTPGDKRKEVLRVIATVLDFNREDRQKTGLESSSSLWPFGKASSPGEKQSLSEAFIRFLESESQPILQMKMGPDEIGRRSSRSSSSSSASPETSGIQTEHPVSEMSVTLPILNQAEKSNSILKDVLNPKP